MGENEKVKIKIIDATGNKEREANVPKDVAASRIIGKLVQMMDLPTTGPDGQLQSYKFHHKRTGKQLMDDETLAEADVQDGDVIRLVPEITAG